MSDSFDPYRVWLGIPPESRPPTHYEMLGISPKEQERAVIEAAMLRQSGYVRNFQIGQYGKEAARVLNEIAAAKACLLDPAKRAKYDAELKGREAAVVQPAAQTVAAPLAAAIDLDQLALTAATLPPAAARLRNPQRRLALAPGKRKPAPLAWQIPVAAAAALMLAAVLFVSVHHRDADEPREQPQTASSVIPADLGSAGLSTAESVEEASEPVVVKGTVLPSDMGKSTDDAAARVRVDSTATAAVSPDESTQNPTAASQRGAPGLSGRYVRIELTGAAFLSLAEVEVFHGDENIAIFGEASQSITWWPWIAALAIDGNTNGDFAAGSATHTQWMESPWWEVDLKSEQPLDRIIVWSRTEGDPNGSRGEHRLAGFRLIVLNDRRERAWMRENIDAPKPNIELRLAEGTSKFEGGESPDTEKPLSANRPVFMDLTQKLNSFQSWTASSGQWSAQNSGICGKGDSRLKFNDKLPPEFTLMLRMRVVAGIRPRILFDDRQFWFGDEGWDHKLSVHGDGQQGTAGAPRAYQSGAALNVACQVGAQEVRLSIDGVSFLRCQRKSAEPLTLELSAGDGFSPGEVIFDSFKLESADFVLPRLTLAQRSSLAQYTNAGTIDVLALIDPARDAKSGKWTADFEGLHSPRDSVNASLRLPVAVPDEYSLSIVAERAKGWKGTAPILNVGHVAAGKQFNSTIDWDGTAGLERIDGRPAHENESTVHCGNLFKDDRTSVVTYIVRRAGVEMLFDGRQILDWKGDYRRFSLQDDWRNPINSPHRLFLGTHCDWHFKAIRLTPLTVADAAPPAAKEPATDLLKTIDLKKHARGGWAFDGPVLVSPPNVTHAGVRFPGVVPDEYRLRIVAERPRGFQGPPQLHVGLVTRSSQATLVLDADHKSGLEAVGGKMYHENATTFQGDLFIDGVESTIECTVDKESIRVDFDGHTIIDWHGDLKQLAPTWTRFGAPKRAFWIGTHCNYRIKKLELVPVTQK